MQSHCGATEWSSPRLNSHLPRRLPLWIPVHDHHLDLWGGVALWNIHLAPLCISSTSQANSGWHCSNPWHQWPRVLCSQRSWGHWDCGICAPWDHFSVLEIGSSHRGPDPENKVDEESCPWRRNQSMQGWWRRYEEVHCHGAKRTFSSRCLPSPTRLGASSRYLLWAFSKFRNNSPHPLSPEVANTQKKPLHSHQKKPVNIAFFSEQFLRALMGRDVLDPFGCHSLLFFFSSTSKTLIHDSSPVIILLKKWGSSRRLCKFNSHIAILNLFCSGVRRHGMNLGASFENLMSFLMMLWTPVLLMLVVWVRSCSVERRSVWIALSTAWMFAGLRALRSRPLLGQSFTSVTPLLNLFIHTLTVLGVTVSAPKTGCNCRQHCMGVAPDFCRNFITVLCSSNDCMMCTETSKSQQ